MRSPRTASCAAAKVKDLSWTAITSLVPPEVPYAVTSEIILAIAWLRHAYNKVEQQQEIENAEQNIDNEENDENDEDEETLISWGLTQSTST